MARPKSENKRTKRVPTMYAPDELAVMKANARNALMSPAAYTRFMTAGVEPDKKLPTEKDEAQIRAIADIQYIRKALEQLKEKVSDDILQEFKAAAHEAVENFNKAIK